MTKTTKTCLLLAIATIAAGQLYIPSGQASMPIGQSTDRGVSSARFANTSTATQAKLDLKQDVMTPGVDYLAPGSAPPSSRTITAGTGLQGGGDLSADRTLSLKISDSTSTTDSTTAASATAVKAAYDLADEKGSGTVTSVSSANADIAVASGTTTPALTLNSGTGANQIVKRNSGGALPDAGVANGLATLDSTGKLPTSELPGSVLGAVVYQGVWNASTNTPTLSSGSCTQGYYRKVSVPGTTTVNGISSWGLGDWIICNGANYDRVAAGVDGVSDIVVTSPLVTSGGGVPTLSMPAATSSVDGYLSHTDWLTFNGKQAPLVSGTSLKTVGGTSLLGSGDIPLVSTLGTSTPTTFTNGTILSSNGSTLSAAGISGTGNLVAVTGATLTGPKETVVAGGICSTGYAINPANGTIITLTLSGPCAISVSSLAAGQSFILSLTQTSITAPTFSSAFKWVPAGIPPTWSTSTTKYDVAACFSPDGVKLICTGGADAR